MKPEQITNARYLNDQAKSRGYTGPEMTSVEALQWLMDNPDGSIVTQSNSQVLRDHELRIADLNTKPTFKGVYGDLKSVENNLLPEDLVNGDYILVGPDVSRYKLYTWATPNWELGHKPIINVVNSAIQLPNDLGRDDTGTIYFVKQEGGVYVFENTKWIAASTPVIIDGYQFNLIIH